MTAAAKKLAAMVRATMVTAVAMRTVPMTMTMTMTMILRTLHRRNYGATIIATATLSRRD